ADQAPIVWDHGKGVWVTDVDGNEYIDFTSGVLVTNLGHSHPKHVSAIQAQAARLMNCYSFPTAERVKLSQRLVDILPKNIDKAFILTTGAEATEAALRIAKRYTQKHEVLSFYGGFHGRTYGAMSVAGNIGTRRRFGPALPGGIMAPFPYCYRCFYDKTYPDCDFYCIKMLDRIINSSSSGDLGTVITEPYQGGAGFIFPPDGWLKKLEKWANERGLVFIVDEVQSSFGRTGKMFAIEWEDIHPQMICLGKGLGSGIPVSALCGESNIFNSMEPGEMSSTTGGNPLSCIGALAVLDIMKEEKLPENSNRMGKYLFERLAELKKKYSFIGDVRGKGLVIGLEITAGDADKTPSNELMRKIIFTAAEYGMLLGSVGLYRNVIRIAPPLVINKEELDHAIDILEMSMNEVNKTT
ncbi:aspartate aminotransferase family protein, partial [candidate division KSB1 bacterium]|nr:aspartate aminotransferase family protein [candidate division KSB1 bacterium]